jgi:uncharacterized repeat protein (TIGR02543 family)
MNTQNDQDKKESKKRRAFFLWFKNPKHLALVGGGIVLLALLIGLTSGGQSPSSANSSSLSSGNTTSAQVTTSQVSSTPVTSSSATTTSATSTSTQATFTLTFETNGGSDIASVDVLSGTTFAEPTAPTRSGYTFSGWYFDNNTFNQPVSFPATMPQANLTIYAKWTINAYTIAFVTNGGTSVSNITANFGESITLPTPSREGYTFDGWFTDVDLTVAFTETTMPAQDTTLYAKWVVKEFLLIYGYTDLPSINVAFGTPITLETLPTPVKTGHTFNGWFSNPSLTTAFTSTTMPAANLTIYGKFTINTYTITFEANGGSSVSPITAQYNANINLNESFKTGYTFAGWFTDVDLTVAFTETTMPAESLTLYAKWTVNQYTVSYQIIYEEEFKDTVSGARHSLALNLENTLFVWGNNANGQLGLGNNVLVRGRPTILNLDTILNPGETIEFIQAGPLASTSFIITSNGRVFGWGSNAYGQVGNGTTTNQFTPVEINFPDLLTLNSEKIIRIYPGPVHTLALSSEGRVFAWGDNQAGQLGLGNTESFTTPQLVSFTDLQPNESIVGISPGGSETSLSFIYTIAYTSLGRLSSWGHNSGKLGDGTTSARTSPVTFSVAALQVGETIVSVTASTTFVLARTSNGRVLSWGAGNNGTLGLGATNSVTIPTLVTFSNLSAGESISTLNASQTHVVVTSSTNRIFAWGLNDVGQLGTIPSFVSSSNVPILVSFSSLEAGESFTKLSAGGRGYSIVLTSANRIVSWGNNEFYEIGNGQGGANVNVLFAAVLNLVFTGETFTDALVLDFGATLTLPTVTLPGFTFVNWYRFESFSNVYTPPTTMPAQNIEIYAGFIRTPIPS